MKSIVTILLTITILNLVPLQSCREDTDGKSTDQNDADFLAWLAQQRQRTDGNSTADNSTAEETQSRFHGGYGIIYVKSKYCCTGGSSQPCPEGQRRDPAGMCRESVK